MVKKPKSTAEKPPPHTDEDAPADERRQSASDRPRPGEPFEECGPSGGYGGAGTDEEE
jgi:hypothetical protein